MTDIYAENHQKDTPTDPQDALAEALKNLDAGWSLWHDEKAVILEAARAWHQHTRLPSPPREGWVFVPVEPTEEMSRIGKHVLKGSADECDRNQAESVYRAMIAAAPDAEEK